MSHRGSVEKNLADRVGERRRISMILNEAEDLYAAVSNAPAAEGADDGRPRRRDRVRRWMVATIVQGFWHILRPAGRRRRDRRAIIATPRGARFRGLEALEARMLLSRQALPAFDLGGPVVPPSFAAVALSITGPPAPAPAPSVDEFARGFLVSARGSEITPLGWLAESPPEPTDFVDDAADQTPAVILLESESGEVWSSLDETETDGRAGAVVEANPADAPDPMLAPTEEDTAEELIYENLDGLDAIPWQAEYTVKGSMDPAQAHIAYRIPVGPGTNHLRLALYSGRADAGGTAPLIDKLYLVDPAGDILARITSAKVDGGGPQLLVTLQGAPEGSQLVVHLVARDAQIPATPGDGSQTGGGFEGEPPPPSAAFTFELNIQRNDPNPPPPPEGGGGSPDSASPTPTQPIPPPAPRADIGGIGWSASQTARLVVDGLVRVERGVSVGGGSSAGAFSWAETGRLAGGRSPSVYLGPLVSRGAAPLGPTLATSVDEPTQLIDRENPAVDEALDRIGSELDAWLLAGLKHRDGPALHNADAPATGTRAIPGAGGLPMLVSATARSRGRAEADALTANLQSRSVEEALTAEIPEAPLPTDQGAEDVRVASAGLITRAAGLVVGLGLATGPLYPDLVALARRKLARGKTSILKRRWFFRRRPTRPVF